MNLYKNYTYSKGRSIWRLLPAGPGLLLIEERNQSTREAFYSCIEISSGKFLFNDFQPEEKIWSGIEEIYRGFIFFHKYAKPDMPIHSGIYAFDITNAEMVWENKDYTFAFINEDSLYCYETLFEGRKYFELDYKTGEMRRELPDDTALINHLYTSRKDHGLLEGYVFPETYIEEKESVIDEIISIVKNNNVISGRVDYIKYKDAVFLSYHIVNDDGTLRNCFNSIDIESKKTILDITLNEKITAFIPDSFFVSNNLLFMLIEKEQFQVYLIN